MARSLLTIVILAGCGRIGFDPRSVGDADGGSGDGPPVAPLCTTWGPFGNLVHVPELSSAASDTAISLSADNRTAVFSSSRLPSAGSYDLYIASRADPSLPFDAPVPLTGLNSAASDSAPTLSADGTDLYFGSNRSGTGQIYVATRSDETQPFGAPVAVPGAINPTAAADPDLTADVLTMYYRFASSSEIWIATRADRGAIWDTAMILEPVSTSGTSNVDTNPAISRDDLELFIGSDRTGSTNVMVSLRAATADVFAPPVDVPVLATTAFAESDPEITDDGTTLWATILDGPSSLGGYDFYYVTRSCLDPSR